MNTPALNMVFLCDSLIFSNQVKSGHLVIKTEKTSQREST